MLSVTPKLAEVSYRPRTLGAHLLAASALYFAFVPLATSFAEVAHPPVTASLIRCASSLNQSRQQSIALCSFSSQRLGFFDLFIEELVEGSNQFLWWTLLDDSAHFVSKTY